MIADRIVTFLEESGTKYVFGVPGSTTVSLINSISNSKKLKFISALNENASIAMADGYSRASGEFATVVLHTTPGLSTALPNLYNSFVDNIPLLLIVGDVNSKALIRQPGLALDRLEDLARPVTRWCYYAKSSTDIITAIERTSAIFSSPQPGPCCVIIPEDLLEEKNSKGFFDPHKFASLERTTITPDQKQISELVSLVDESRWPVLIVGREIHGEASIRSLVEFCERLAIPVLVESPYPSIYNTSFPQDNACYLGPFRRESEAMKDVDLILGLGGKLFTERKYYEEDPFDDKTKVVHIHENPWELGKNIKTHVRILGTPDRAALMLNEASKSLDNLAKGKSYRSSRLARMEQIYSKRLKEEEELASRVEDGGGIKPWKLVRALQDVLNEGQRMGRGFTIVDEGVVTSSYLSELFVFSRAGSLIGRSAGCLGWGVNAAIGAKLALPERKVVAFVGDGALLFCPQGLWTAAHYNIPITVIVCNNAGYASVELSYDSLSKRLGMERVAREGTKFTEPRLDIVKLAESFGVAGISVTKEEDLPFVLEKSVSSPHALELIDVHIDPRERGYEGSTGQSSAWT